MCKWICEAVQKCEWNVNASTTACEDDTSNASPIEKQEFRFLRTVNWEYGGFTKLGEENKMSAFLSHL